MAVSAPIALVIGHAARLGPALGAAAALGMGALALGSLAARRSRIAPVSDEPGPRDSTEPFCSPTPPRETCCESRDQTGYSPP
jgi:hypothetical protein